jgi:hypothetical protein
MEFTQLILELASWTRILDSKRYDDPLETTSLGDLSSNVGRFVHLIAEYEYHHAPQIYASQDDRRPPFARADISGCDPTAAAR